MNTKQAKRLREGVRNAYSAAAESPQDTHPFPVGRRFAESLGYSPQWIAGLPAVAVEAFSGVSNVAVLAAIPVGATVLDLGCGAGLDTLVAARRTGSQGRVIGLDFSAARLVRGRQALAETGLGHVALCQADAECLPVQQQSIDVAMVNGIFNLNPARDTIFRELARVVRRGGAVYAAELILQAPLSAEIQDSATDWFA